MRLTLLKPLKTFYLVIQHRALRKLLCLAPLLCLQACVTWQTIGTEPIATGSGQITAQGPQGWLALAPGQNTLFISRDGPAAHYVKIEKKLLSNAFARTKAAVSNDTLLTDLADYYTAEIKTARTGLKINVESVEPLKISGKNGVKTHYHYANQDGLTIDLICYFLVYDNHLYEIVYETPRLHLFERDRKLVESFVASVRL